MSELIDRTGPPRPWADPELAVWRRAAAGALTEVDPGGRIADVLAERQDGSGRS